MGIEARQHAGDRGLHELLVGDRIDRIVPNPLKRLAEQVELLVDAALVGGGAAAVLAPAFCRAVCGRAAAGVKKTSSATANAVLRIRSSISGKESRSSRAPAH